MLVSINFGLCTFDATSLSITLKSVDNERKSEAQNRNRFTDILMAGRKRWPYRRTPAFISAGGGPDVLMKTLQARE